MSTKRLQAQMIRTNTKLTYNNSRITSIYSNMLSLNFETNKRMFIQYKYECYIRYFNNLLQGNISQNMKNNLSQMLTAILADLTEEEYIHVFQIKPPEPPPLPKMTTDSGMTFYMSHHATTARSYFVFKNLPVDFLLKLNTYYTFDVSDPSNLNTKLSFSEEENTGIPYRGIYYISVPGTPGAKMILNIYNDVKTLKMYTFNDIDIYDDLKYNWGYSVDGLVTDLYKGSSKKSYYTYLYARQFSYLSVYEYAGPKYAINDTIEPILFTGLNPNRYYVTYGTYYLDIPDYYPATLLNKGYEDCVSFVGDANKKVMGTIYGLNMTEGTPQEGVYAFYYGRVKLSVYKPFPFHMSVYSKDFGFIGTSSMFQFINEIKEVSGTDVMNLSSNLFNKVSMTTMLRFNQDISNNTRRKYGFKVGRYSIFIPPELPVAFMNDSKEELFDIIDTFATKIGPFTAPDNKSYLFYTGIVYIEITGNFGKISMCTRNGYSGGYNLLVYNSYYGPPLSSPYKSNLGVAALRAQTNLFFKGDVTVFSLGSTVQFNQESTKYGLYKGVYIIFNIPRKCPITLLNQGKESLVTLESLTNSTIKGSGPDGTAYTFYHDILKITVRGDFGYMSLYTLYDNYMGGFKMFSYDSFFDNSDSYPDPSSVPVIATVTSNTSFTQTKLPDIVNSFINSSTDNTIDYGNIWETSYITNTLYVGTRVSFEANTLFRMRYYLTHSVYVLNSANHFITLLNKGKEYLINVKGNVSRKAIASDGNEYTFYSGNMIAIYVLGDFDIMSLEVLGGPIGKDLFAYLDTP